MLRALWSGESVDFDGEFHHLRGAMQRPTPVGHIPIVIGGTGKKTLELVARHADWWNLQIGNLHRLEELRAQVGDARTSVQQMVCFIPSEKEREEVEAAARRRFAAFGDVIMFGTAPELVDQIGALADRGVERLYTWFTDFADPATLAAFGRKSFPTSPPPDRAVRQCRAVGPYRFAAAILSSRSWDRRTLPASVRRGSLTSSTVRGIL